MKIVTVDGGARRIPIAVPDDALVLEYAERPVAGDPARLTEAALEAPLGLPTLGGMVRSIPRAGSHRIVVAFDDPNRPQATVRTLLPSVLRHLEAAGVEDRELTLISADGMHPKFSRDSLRAYLGEEAMKRFGDRVVNHDCDDAEGLVNLGTTAFGDVLEFNRAAVESDLLVYVGNIATNIWGGYSGSGVVVGLGGVASMLGHHGRGGIGHDDSCHGDPRTMLYQRRKLAISEALERQRAQPTFYAEAMTDGRGVVDVFAGRAAAIQARAWPEADRRFIGEARAADVVVVGLALRFLYGTSDNPLNALTGVCFPLRLWLGTPLLRAGGVVIGVTDSAGTVDPATHPGYAEAIREFGRSRSFDALERHAERVGRDPGLVRRYREGGAYHPYHPFWLFNEDEYAMKVAGRIIMAGARESDLYANLGCLVTPSFEAAWDEARRRVGPDPRVVVLPSYWSRPRIKFHVTG